MQGDKIKTDTILSSLVSAKSVKHIEFTFKNLKKMIMINIPKTHIDCTLH